MIYNFKVSASLSAEETSDIADKTLDGLEVSGTINALIRVEVNTELPPDKVDALKSAVGDLVADTFGADASVELASIEH